MFNFWTSSQYPKLGVFETSKSFHAEAPLNDVASDVDDSSVKSCVYEGFFT